MPTPEESYEKLLEFQRTTSVLNSCTSVLRWDRETYLPLSGASHRAEQLALLSGISHERSTNQRIDEWLSECESSKLFSEPHSVSNTNIREWRKNYDKNVKIPGKLVEEITHTISMGHKSWIESRNKSDYSIFLPWLTKIIALKRHYAELLVTDNKSIYDTLLDDYEPGESAENISQVFSQLRDELMPVIDKIVTSAHQPNLDILHKNYSIEKQKSFGEDAAKTIGFNFDAGRLDTVVHPFCTGLGPHDTRITTRWDSNNIASAFFGIMHETGHAIYDQNLPSGHWGSPAGSSVSPGIHESQSRLWENIIARDKPFWNCFYPKLQRIFSKNLSNIPLEDFLHAINYVKRSHIRVEADEITYTLHIILRFEIEQLLITGKLNPIDLPEFWNKRFKELFDLDVPDDANGCLQDVHWSYGSFGYFPAYALGNLYAAQFYDNFKKKHPDVDDEYNNGNFMPLLNWLIENIHSKGMCCTAPELIKHVTDEPLNHLYLIKSLKNKFYPLYNI